MASIQLHSPASRTYGPPPVAARRPRTMRQRSATRRSSRSCSSRDYASSRGLPYAPTSGGRRHCLPQPSENNTSTARLRAETGPHGYRLRFDSDIEVLREGRRVYVRVEGPEHLSDEELLLRANVRTDELEEAVRR